MDPTFYSRWKPLVENAINVTGSAHHRLVVTITTVVAAVRDCGVMVAQALVEFHDVMLGVQVVTVCPLASSYSTCPMALSLFDSTGLSSFSKA